jgi:hypothetical protein
MDDFRALGIPHAHDFVMECASAKRMAGVNKRFNEFYHVLPVDRPVTVRFDSKITYHKVEPS